MRALLCLSALFVGVLAKDPTLYEYYTSGGIKTGLEANNADHFTLNGKPYIIYSGSFHFFRVVPQHWRPILQRFKAAGLNAVQLYLPWNLHEDTPGHFDFTSPALNLATFLEEIKQADMFAIVRPGPYICAEWEMGGYPSWLIRDPHMKLRSNYKPYLQRVKPFWEEALKIINKYQFSSTGGPVIMLQTENEYSGGIHHPDSDEYLNYLLDIVKGSGFKQLIFNSDPGGVGVKYPIKGIYKDNSVLQTSNLNSDALKLLTELKKNQPGKPAFVSEFWPGWFDFWGKKEGHHRYSVEKFDHEISDLLFKVNGSVNFYMFIGGTNFGFTNGQRVVTSYDYDAPLSESGNYTPKYHKTRELYQKLVATGRFPKIYLPEIPAAPQAHAYGKVQIHETLSLELILEHAIKFVGVKKPVPMELLNIGKDYGQRFGFVLYRVEGKEVGSYEVTGKIRDHATFLVDQKETGEIEDGTSHFLHIFKQHSPPSPTIHKYDLLVENLGRVNGGDQMNHDRKGILDGDIKLDGKVIDNITIYSLDFNQTFVQSLKTGWAKFDAAKVAHSPAMYRTTLKVDHPTPNDTYLLLEGWTKGNVFVNGFNIGRYWKVGPQKTLYVPGPLLKQGENIIEVFEQHKPGHELQFIDHPILE